MPHRLAQRRMTLSDLECLKPSSSLSCSISVVAELLVTLLYLLNMLCNVCMCVWVTHDLYLRVESHRK